MIRPGSAADATTSGVPTRGKGSDETAVAVVDKPSVDTAAPVDTRAPGADPPINQFEKYYRLGNSIGVQFLGGDVPAGLSVWANTSSFPQSLGWAVPVINVVNTVTGYAGIAADMRVNHAADQNPRATHLDHVVDQVHFVVGDLVNTASSMIPLFTPVTNNPLMFGLFAGGQALGASFDLAKIGYDWYRQGQQSAVADPNDPKNLVLDRFEKKVGQVAQTGGLVALQSIALPNSLISLSAPVAGALMSAGGSFGAVFAYNQYTKAKDLEHLLTDMKSKGTTTIAYPEHTAKGLVTREMDIDTAIHRARHTKDWGIAQGASSAMMIAAGVPGLQFLAIPALVTAVVVNTAAAAESIYENRHEIAKGLHHIGTTVQHTVHVIGTNVENAVIHLVHPDFITHDPPAH